MRTVITIILLAFLFSGCMTKSEINFSLLNGYWIRSDSNKGSHMLFGKIYVSDGNMLIQGMSGLRRNHSFKCTYRIVGNELQLKIKYGHSSDLQRYNILELNKNRLVIGFQSGGNNVVFERKIKDQCHKIKSINLAYNGLQANDIEVDKNLICKSAFNQDTPEKIRVSKVPKWKWKGLEYMCNSIELKSIIIHDDHPPVPDGGEFAMIIELENGRLFRIMPAEKLTDYGFICETVWDLGIYDEVKREHKKGVIKFHDELSEMYPRHIPTSIETLKFVPPLK